MTTDRETARLPGGWWQMFAWYASATMMTLGHASTFIAAWFAGVAVLYALAFTAGAIAAFGGRP